MAVIEATLAVAGLVLLIVLAIGAVVKEPAEAPLEDATAPYREGLYAAARLQQAEHEFEQRLYAEALRQAELGQMARQATLRDQERP